MKLQEAPVSSKASHWAPAMSSARSAVSPAASAAGQMLGAAFASGVGGVRGVSWRHHGSSRVVPALRMKRGVSSCRIAGGGCSPLRAAGSSVCGRRRCLQSGETGMVLEPEATEHVSPSVKVLRLARPSPGAPRLARLMAFVAERKEGSRECWRSAADHA